MPLCVADVFEARVNIDSSLLQLRRRWAKASEERLEDLIGWQIA